MTVYPRTMGKQINMQFTNTIRYLGLVLFTKRKWEIWQGRPVCVCVCVLELSRYIFTISRSVARLEHVIGSPPHPRLLPPPRPFGLVKRQRN